MDEIPHICDTCEHLNDSSSEYCGSCDSVTDNWKEAGWQIEKRLSEKIARLEEENAELRQAINKLREDERRGK